MRVAALQYEIAWEDKPANFDKVRRLLNAASLMPNTLVVLPEMFATGFSMNGGSIAEPIDGPTATFLAQCARDFKVYVTGGVVVRSRDGACRNSALSFAPSGDLVSFYAKMRLFSPGGEHKHYAAGSSPRLFQWADLQVAPYICYDLRFPEIFRQAALSEGPELYLVIASWPAKRADHWTRLLSARAIENQAYVIGVNRTGSDPFYQYGGQSLILGYNGEVLADAGAGESVIQADLDLERLRKYRAGLPFLKG